MSSDLTFIANEDGRSLRERFYALRGANTRCFDCLVGYFFINGFRHLYPALDLQGGTYAVQATTSRRFHFHPPPLNSQRQSSNSLTKSSSLSATARKRK